MRVGIGIDFHRFTVGRKLILGGVEIPHERGLVGHSDADVLVHAICDALLGAAALGDIGQHFPDTDAKFQNISSLELLREVRRKLAERRLQPYHIDAVVIAEAPKLSHYKKSMAQKIAITLGLSENQVSIKATTAEQMGALGRREGIAAQAVATLCKRQSSQEPKRRRMSL
jgi:2-C-methyl-D-erythritol 2,4-cyclodiphosphate synthase